MVLSSLWARILDFGCLEVRIMDLNVAPESSLSLSNMYRCHAVEKMTRNSNVLMRDGSVMADSGLVDFLSGSTDSAINFNGSADLHTPIHPPP